MKLCFEENQIHLNIFISCAMTGLNFLPGGFNQSITVWEVHQSLVPEKFWRKSVFCFQNRIAESATWLTALLSHVLQYQHATTCWWPAQRLAFIQILREGFGKKEIINDFCHFLVHFFHLQLNLTYMKQILHLVSVKNRTFKSSYNWYKYWHSSAAPATDCQLLIYLAMFIVNSTIIYT